MRTRLATRLCTFSVLVAAALLCDLAPASATGVRTIRKDIRQEIVGAMSQNDARKIAIARAKREAVEEAGTYLESYSVVHNSNLADDTIVALAGGVLKTEILREEEYVDGGAHGIRVVAEIVVDTSVLDERIRKLLADREHLARLEAVEKRERVLLAKIAALEAENSRFAQSGGGTAAQHRKLREEIADTATRLTAREWWDRGQALWNSSNSSYEPALHAVEYFTNTIERDPDFFEAYGARASALGSLGQLEAATKDLNQIIAGISRMLDADPESDHDPSHYYNRGTAYARLGERQKSIADFNHALRLQPDLVVAFYNRGFVYFSEGEYQRAVADFSEALRLDPRFAAAYNNRGTAYGAVGQFERAIADFNRALHLDPKMAAAYGGRGLANRELGNRSAACTDWRLAAELGHSKAQQEVQRECQSASSSR